MRFRVIKVKQKSPFTTRRWQRWTRCRLHIFYGKILITINDWWKYWVIYFDSLATRCCYTCMQAENVWTVWLVCWLIYWLIGRACIICLSRSQVHITLADRKRYATVSLIHIVFAAASSHFRMLPSLHQRESRRTQCYLRYGQRRRRNSARLSCC